MDREAIEALIREKMPTPILDIGWWGHDRNKCWIRLNLPRPDGKVPGFMLDRTGLSEGDLRKRVDVMCRTAGAALEFGEFKLPQTDKHPSE